MINKITKIIQSTAMFVAILVVMPSVTFAEAPSPSDAPSITDQGNGGVVSGAGSAPAVTDQGNGGVVSGGGSAPATTDQGNGGVVGSSPATPPTPPTSPTTGGGTSSGGSSRSGGRSGGRSVVAVENLTPANCFYLNDYLSINSKNSEMEVIKLQAFLLNTEKLNVDINGKFDSKTFEAVKQFQKKYSNEVLSPWGSSIPTGKVFYTTKKKINEIHCNSLFPLTAQQNYEINAYKNRPVVSVVVSSPETTITPDLDILLDEQVSTSTNVEDINDTQSGVVIKAPFTTRVYNFVKWLFAF